MVQSQIHFDVVCNFHAPLAKYGSCTCEYALHGNLCNHQVVVLLACTDLSKDDIINYYTWYGTGCRGFKAMFMDLKYLEANDGSSEDEGYK